MGVPEEDPLEQYFAKTPIFFAQFVSSLTQWKLRCSSEFLKPPHVIYHVKYYVSCPQKYTLKRASLEGTTTPAPGLLPINAY